MEREPFNPDRVPRRGGDGKVLDAALETLSSAVIGAAIEVHRELGPGFPEPLYEQAMAIELHSRRILFEQQPWLTICYKGQVIGKARPDLVIEKVLIVELKSVEALAPIHTGQLVSYLRAMNFRLGLLMNFNVRLMRDGLRRVIL